MIHSLLVKVWLWAPVKLDLPVKKAHPLRNKFWTGLQLFLIECKTLWKSASSGITFRNIYRFCFFLALFTWENNFWGPFLGTFKSLWTLFTTVCALFGGPLALSWSLLKRRCYFVTLEFFLSQQVLFCVGRKPFKGWKWLLLFLCRSILPPPIFLAVFQKISSLLCNCIFVFCRPIFLAVFQKISSLLWNCICVFFRHQYFSQSFRGFLLFCAGRHQHGCQTCQGWVGEGLVRGATFDTSTFAKTWTSFCRKD